MRAGESLDGWDAMDSGSNPQGFEKLREEVKSQIDYDVFVTRDNRSQFDEIVEIIVKTLASHKGQVSFSDSEHSIWMVKERLRKINLQHIKYIFDRLRKNRTMIRNIKKYLSATLFNAPVTMGNYYDCEVWYDGLI